MRVTRTEAMLSPAAWAWLTGLTVFAAIVIPLLNRLLPEASAYHVPGWIIELFGKFICFAIVALAINLIWGYTGILSLGHGVFFALGAYLMGMHMAKYMNDVLHVTPDFMAYMQWQGKFPWFWAWFENFSYGLFMALLIPGLFAFIFGYFAFRSRIKGVYFAIITQALTYGMWQLFLRNETGFGGSNGFTNFKSILGFSLVAQEESRKLGLMWDDKTTKLALYIIAVLTLCACFLLCRYIVTSKYGRVLRAIRDAESRAAFLGYNTLRIKLFVWTVSAVLCAVAGILYVPQVGIINPNEMHPVHSIEMVIWVAVGGRGSLVGAMLGATVVNGTKTVFTTGGMSDYWLFVLGGLAILVTLFFRGGLVDRGSYSRIAQQLRQWFSIKPSATHRIPQILFGISSGVLLASAYIAATATHKPVGGLVLLLLYASPLIYLLLYSGNINSSPMVIFVAYGIASLLFSVFPHWFFYGGQYVMLLVALGLVMLLFQPLWTSVKKSPGIVNSILLIVVVLSIVMMFLVNQPLLDFNAPKGFFAVMLHKMFGVSGGIFSANKWPAHLFFILCLFLVVYLGITRAKIPLGSRHG